MSEKDLELLVTLDAPQDEDEDPHYQFELEDTSNSEQIVEQNLFNHVVGTQKEIE